MVPVLPSQTSPIVGNESKHVPTTLSAYNIFKPRGSKMVFLRRICMVLFLLVVACYSVFNSIIMLMLPIMGEVNVIMACIGRWMAFIWLARWMARIAEVYGRRRVLRMTVGRKQYDWFLVVFSLWAVTVEIGFAWGLEIVLIGAVVMFLGVMVGNAKDIEEDGDIV